MRSIGLGAAASVVCALCLQAGASAAACRGLDAPPAVIDQNAHTLTVGERSTALPAAANGLLPLSAVVRAFGGAVSWDAATRTATVDWRLNQARFTAGAATSALNGVPKTLEQAPRIEGGRLMVPAAALAPVFGYRQSQIDAASIRWNPVPVAPTQLVEVGEHGGLIYRLSIGPALAMSTDGDVYCDELIVGGQPAAPHPVNRHLDLHVTDVDGRARVGLDLRIDLENLSTHRRVPLRTLELYRTGEPGDDHYGNNLYLPPGRYAVWVETGGATFDFVLNLSD